MAARVKRASRILARQTSEAKNNALSCMANALLDNQDAILDANREDVEQARALDIAPAFVDRLALTPERIQRMSSDLAELLTLPDPIGRIERMNQRPNGLMVGRQRIPLGVIGIIYEARPNVTSDATGLCLKSGNGVLLKGGSHALSSNRAVYHALRQGLSASTLDKRAHDSIGFLDTKDRSAVAHMLTLDESIDVVIPRGGKKLISFVKDHSRIPVIKHDEGVCHLVVEGSAREEEVVDIALNGKVQRPSVCNSIETILFLENAADTHLRHTLNALTQAGVTLDLCPTSMAVAQQEDIDASFLRPADDEAYAREYLSLEVAIKVVPDLDGAIEHLDRFSSNHTESLLTQNYELSQRFLREVDSSVVMINASTRFSDGNQLGLGAEIGISTTRMHAYGPMGLEELTTTKFIVMGQGQIRP